MSDEIVLDPSQERAVQLMLTAGFGVVTGGPGCGKSTTLKTALDLLDRQPAPVDSFGDTMPRYRLAAPTGKAARRMQEVTGRDAGTLHRLLEYSPAAGGFQRNEDFPIDAGVVFVDEASMVDVRLMDALTNAIDRNRTRLVLVGDANQLPSVGPGRVLGDLVDDPSIEVARLTKLHRAAAESWVCRNAPTILAGKEPELAPIHDFRFIETETSEGAARAIVELVGGDTLKGELSQVLTPQKPGPGGVQALNRAIQARVNPRVQGEPTTKLGDAGELRMRDRVLQTKNDYTRLVFNGEVGVVVSIERDAVVVDFDGRLISYDAIAVRALDLAYALTIHKSQGSEWPWVIVLCHSAHTFMLDRQLFYTAITRAKKGVVVVGDKKGLKAALKEPTPRFTTLPDCLKAGASAAAPASRSAS